MSQESFTLFRQYVFMDESVQKQLRDIAAYEEFIELVIRLGNENGYNFTAEYVEEALREGRRSWVERGI